MVATCRQFQIPATAEISRSGNGAHLWIFFSSAMPAVEARQLGAALISYTCSHSRQLELASYDRMFPNQERMPKGGFGNLIALPLQKEPRDQGRSIFVDNQLQLYLDQWVHLKGIERMDDVGFATSIQQGLEQLRQLDAIELHLYENDRLMKEFGEDCALSEAFSHIDRHFLQEKNAIAAARAAGEIKQHLALLERSPESGRPLKHSYEPHVLHGATRPPVGQFRV